MGGSSQNAFDLTAPLLPRRSIDMPLFCGLLATNFAVLDDVWGDDLGGDVSEGYEYEHRPRLLEGSAGSTTTTEASPTPFPTQLAGPGVCAPYEKKGKWATLVADDCFAWQAGFDSLNGPMWTKCFDKRNDPCGSDCASCQGDRIIQIDLRSNNVTGKLPSEWGALGKLQLMYLFDNTIKGTVPQSWVNIKSLYLFQLWGNQLSGVLPQLVVARCACVPLSHPCLASCRSWLTAHPRRSLVAPSLLTGFQAGTASTTQTTLSVRSPLATDRTKSALPRAAPRARSPRRRSGERRWPPATAGTSLCRHPHPPRRRPRRAHPGPHPRPRPRRRPRPRPHRG